MTTFATYTALVTSSREGGWRGTIAAKTRKNWGQLIGWGEKRNCVQIKVVASGIVPYHQESNWWKFQEFLSTFNEEVLDSFLYIINKWKFIRKITISRSQQWLVVWILSIPHFEPQYAHYHRKFWYWASSTYFSGLK